MHALLVKVDLDPKRRDETNELLHSFTIPAAKQMPGFISGTWARALDGSHGQGLVIFESEAAARNAGEQAAQGPPPGSPATFVSAEVLEVVAQV